MNALWRWTSWVVLLATTALAGTHTVYYLYHWEWVRAQVAAIAFVATLVVIGTRLVWDRVGRLEAEVLRRLDGLTAAAAAAPAAAEAGHGQPPAAVAVPRAAPGAIDPVPVPDPDPGADVATVPAPDLPWLAAELSPPRHGLVAGPALLLAALVPGLLGDLERGPVVPAVFIPVLLGAGIAVSLVAGLVEHLSAAVHHQPSAAPGPAPAVPAARRPPWPVLVSGLLVVGALAVAGIWSTAHYRPAEVGEGTTRLTVRVQTQTSPVPAEETVDLVGRFCARHAIDGVTVVGADPVSAGTALLVVRPRLDEEGQRRFGGCLQDATLDRHVLTVVEVRLLPEETS